MKLPSAVLPLLEQTLKSPLVPPGVPLEIWKAEDHRSWVNAFTEFGLLLFQADIPEDALPHGYAQLAYLFDWETQCQFSGWSAFNNRSETIGRVLECYREVGLEQEAEALQRALVAWESTEGDIAATSAAYNEVRHAYSVDLDRLEHLACHFVDNADQLFYSQSEA